MKGGFSFCGVDIYDLGLTYVPETSNIFAPHAGAGFNVSASTDTTTDGGYFFGTTLKPKEFSLRCMFEDTDVRSGIVAKTLNLFRRGRTGRLVFKTMDWIWYTATVTDTVGLNNFSNYRNGFINLKLTAYYPFGRSDIATLDDVAGAGLSCGTETLLANSAFVDLNLMPTLPGSSAGWENNEVTTYVYNPGTEIAKCAVEMKGDFTNGITVTNKTTGQSFEIVGINTQTFLVSVDSMNGKVIKYDPNDKANAETAFLYHKGGFIDLAPGIYAERNVTFRGNGSKKCTPTNPNYIPREAGDTWAPDETYIGKWILVPEKKPIKITGIDGAKFVTDKTVASNGVSVTGAIVDQMNVITFKRKTSGTTLDNVRIDYKATFR